MRRARDGLGDIAILERHDSEIAVCACERSTAKKSETFATRAIVRGACAFECRCVGGLSGGRTSPTTL